MNTLFKHTLAASVLSTMLVGTAFAAPTEKPDEFVKKVADNLIKRLNAESKANNLKKPDVIRDIVQDNLEPHLDARGFTKFVMGANGKDATPQMVTQFENNLRESLIRTYGSALGKFNGQTYKIKPSKYVANAKTANVSIEFDPKGDRIPVTFHLVDINNQWKVRNMKVSGVDLGVQFRTQFSSAVKSQGSLQKAINNFKPNADNAIKK